MVKRVVGKKEKVAKAVDKCIRSVGKRVNACRSPHRAFADTLTRTIAKPAVGKHFEVFALLSSAKSKQVITCFCACRRWLGKGKEAVLASYKNCKLTFCC